MSMWVAGGMAVASVAASLYSSNSAAKSSAKQAGAMSKAENEAVIRSNMQSVVRNNYKAGMMNMQLGLRKKQLAQEGHSITVESSKMLGAATANASAAGNVGSSVDAIITDINMKTGEAQAQQRENYQGELTNFNNELEALSLSAEGEVQRAKQYEYNGPSSGQMWGQALMAGASSFMNTYGAKALSLNTGTQSGTTAAGLTKASSGYMVTLPSGTRLGG